MTLKKIFILIFILTFISSCSTIDSSYQFVKDTGSNIYDGISGTFKRKKVVYNWYDYKIGYHKKEIAYKNQFKRASFYSLKYNEQPKKLFHKEPSSKKNSIASFFNYSKNKKYKMAPYVVNGVKYYPMTLPEAAKYQEKGMASWYGFETSIKKDGHITANGEPFHPEGISAAHKILPIPVTVRVTNLKNYKSLIVRVNDRGPFIEKRVIDLSAGAARRLGYYDSGTTIVMVKTVSL